MHVLGRFGSLFHPSRDGRGRFLVLGTTAAAVVVTVVPVGSPFGRAGRRWPPAVVRRTFVGHGRRRLGPVMVVMMRFRFGRRRRRHHRRGHPVVQLRGGRLCRRSAVAVVAVAIAAVDQHQRVFAATGHFVLHETAYVRQQEHSLTLAARQQVDLVGAGGALGGIRIRCEKKILSKINVKRMGEPGRKKNRNYRALNLYRTRV